MRRNICIFPGAVAGHQLTSLNCHNHSHFHMRLAEVEAAVTDGRAKWVVCGHVAAIVVKYGARGLSCYVGEELVRWAQAGEPWARVAIEAIIHPNRKRT